MLRLRRKFQCHGGAPPAAIFIRRIATTDWTSRLNFTASIQALTSHICPPIICCVARSNRSARLFVPVATHLGALSGPAAPPRRDVGAPLAGSSVRSRSCFAMRRTGGLLSWRAPVIAQASVRRCRAALSLECRSFFAALGVMVSMYRVAFIIRVVLMTIAVVSVGVAAFLIASIALEWL